MVLDRSCDIPCFACSDVPAIQSIGKICHDSHPFSTVFDAECQCSGKVFDAFVEIVEITGLRVPSLQCGAQPSETLSSLRVSIRSELEDLTTKIDSGVDVFWISP